MADRAVQSLSAFNPGIHGARGLFCLAVVLYHIWNSGLPRWPVPDLINQAMESLRYGVELFFAISGFVIFVTMRPVLAGQHSPLDFLYNRATRIFPVLWATIIVFLPMALFKGEDRVAEHLTPLWLFGLKLAGNFLALGPILPVPVLYGVAWTIGYEVVFYALCFAYLAGRIHAGRNLALPVILIGLVLIVLHPRALFFVSGMLVAQGAFAAGPLRRLTVWPLAWLGVFLAAWHGVAAAQSPFFPPLTQWNPGQWLLGLLAFVALTSAIAGIARGQDRFCRLLQSPPFHWLGTISYSLYLWHLIVLGVVKFGMAKLGLTIWAGGAAQLVLLCIALPGSLAMAHLSQRLLEHRLTGWLRRRWRHPRHQQVTPAAAMPDGHRQRP